MRNQFFYTRTVKSEEASTEGAISTTESRFRDSLNLDMVIRSVTLPSGEVVVLLNDCHEQWQQVPITDGETGETTSYREVRTNVQSEITLSAEDGKRFWEWTNVESACTSASTSSSSSSSSSSSKGSKTKTLSVTE